MNWDWVRSWSPLALAVLFLLGAAIALERENVDAAIGLSSVGYLMVGIWTAVELHDRWKDD